MPGVYQVGPRLAAGRFPPHCFRDSSQTVLFVADLETGLERSIHDKLERDNQETWAIHGVYPALAWTRS
jgi:hypothetical protein